MSGRIPQYFIDDLLARIDIVDIVDNRVKLKKTGRNYSACCPFHKEKTPSFTVSPDKQFYYCFGCGASGNALGFVMDHDHLDFLTAVDSLAGIMGLEIPKEQNDIRRRGPDNTELYGLMNKAVEFYIQQLRQHNQSSRAINYLKGRGLDGQIAKNFAIGFAPPGWNNLQNDLGGSPEKEKKLINTGMLVENEDSGRIYDRFRDRIMFPIRDSRGRYIAFGGRVLGDEKPKYLNSPESPIFHKGKELYGLYEARQANRKLNRIIVVEGYMDVVALAQQGITTSVATLGTATTADHMQRLFKVVPEVLFCFDGDDAGRRAAWRALESTLPNMTDGRQARFMFLPQGEDPDSMVRQEGAEHFLERLQSQALSLDNFLFRELEDGLDLTTMDGRARLAKLAQPYLSKLPEGLFYQLLIKKLADITGLDSNYLKEHFEEDITAQHSARPETAAPPLPQKNARGKNISGGFSQTTSTSPAPPPADFSDPDFYAQEQNDYYQHDIHDHRDNKTSDNPLLKRTASYTRKKSTLLATAGYAIRQLLCNPEFAHETVNTDLLKLESDPDSELLIELLNTLKQQPTLSTATLIAQWYGTEKGNRLQSLASLDHGTTAHHQEFLDTLASIRDKVKKQQQKANFGHLRKSLQNKGPGQIDEIQREKLLEDLHLLRMRHGVGKNPEKK